MHTKGGSPVAFVEYQDVRYAAQAMATLQGSFLLSSDRGAIRIEYAKSKMAEVGFTNLWIEVGSTLCYNRLRRTSERGGSIGDRPRFRVLGPQWNSRCLSFLCLCRAKMVPRMILACARYFRNAKAFLAYIAHVESLDEESACCGQAWSLRTRGLRTPRVLACAPKPLARVFTVV